MVPQTTSLFDSDKFLNDKLQVRIVETTKDIPISSEISSNAFLSSIIGLPVPNQQDDERSEDYQVRCSTFMMNVGQKFVAVELQFTNSNAGRRQLAELINFSLINRFSGFDFGSRSSSTVSMVNTREIRNQIQLRDDHRNTLTLGLYYACYAIAHSREARDYLAMEISGKAGLNLPVFFVELLENVRSGKSGNYFVTPRMIPLSRNFLEAANLTESALDYSWITSRQGVSQFVDLMMQLSCLVDSSEGLLNKFILTKTIPYFRSTEPLTIPVYSVCRGDEIDGLSTRIIYNTYRNREATYTQMISQNQRIYALPFSYGNTNSYNAVHLTESIFWSRRLIDANGNDVPVIGFSKTFDSDGLRSVITNYVVYRVMGHLLNGPFKSKRNQSVKATDDINDMSGSPSTPPRSKGESSDHQGRAVSPPPTVRTTAKFARPKQGRGRSHTRRKVDRTIDTSTLTWKNNPFLNHRDLKVILSAVNQFRDLLKLVTSITNTQPNKLSYR